jgi:hypothetical protein
MHLMRTRSPFPGMDPWLESHWNGVHPTIIISLRRQAFLQLPEGLYAEVEENVYVVDADQTGKLFRPDVGVFDSLKNEETPWKPSHQGSVAVAEPVRLVFNTEPIVEGHIEIRDLRGDNKLVTVIEVLSPTNKNDIRARSAYLAKREAYYAADANVVELDLLRGGQPLIGLPLEYVEPVSEVPYKCVIRRSNPPAGKTKMDYYRIGLRTALPTIRVPLRPGDAEIELDLRSPLDSAYEEGRFGIRIDYSKPPVPPLTPSDAAWAAELLSNQK